MFIGYARVSTDDQTVALQQDALTAAGCTKICTDTSSGASTDRRAATASGPRATLVTGSTCVSRPRWTRAPVPPGPCEALG